MISTVPRDCAGGYPVGETGSAGALNVGEHESDGGWEGGV